MTEGQEGISDVVDRVRLAPGKTLVEQIGTGDRFTESGLVLPDREGTANQRNRFEARVLAIGAMEWTDDRAVERACWYAVDDRVSVSSYNPVDLWLEGRSMVIIDTDDVVAVIDRSCEARSRDRIAAAVQAAMMEVPA